jgi:hypothetical protein
LPRSVKQAHTHTHTHALTSLFFSFSAQVSAQQTANTNNRNTHFRFQLAGVTAQINNWMNQKEVDFERIYGVISSLITTVRALNEASSDLYQNIFIPGNMSIAYYSAETILSFFRGGNMMMLVDPSTRIPPRNVSEYTVISSMNLIFNWTNPQVKAVFFFFFFFFFLSLSLSPPHEQPTLVPLFFFRLQECTETRARWPRSRP